MKQLTREQFEALYGGSGMVRPDPSVQWTGQAVDPFYTDSYRLYATDPVAYDHDIAYALSRQQGLSHEASVQAAQRMLGRRVSELVGRENTYNSMIARMPLQMPIPITEAPAAAPVAPGPVVIGTRQPKNETDLLERQRLLGLIAMMANERGPVVIDAGSSGGPVPVVITPGAGASGPPQVEVVEQMAQQEPPKARSGRRMAMRWGLPALGVGAGLYALSGVGANSGEPVESGYR